MKSHSETTPTPTMPDFDWSLAFFEKRGREQFGPEFKIHACDHDTIYKLLTYFLNIPQEAVKVGIDLRKGLLITGPVGCGKTSWLSLMRVVPTVDRNYVVKSCRDVSFEFIQDGYAVIDRYSRLSYRENGAKTYSFDDLGAERNIKYYGNECNVMGEILLSRYDHFMHGMVTHVTTNLSAAELEDAYGNRVRSRMRQMFNLVSFGKASGDKRS